MRSSQLCFRFIGSEEGVRLFPYDDHDGVRLHFDQGRRLYLRADGTAPLGYPTIGTGHLIRSGEVFGDITIEQNDDLLRRDLADVEAALNRQIPDGTPGWNQHRYDMAIDFGINCGQLALTKYGITELILAGRYDDPELERRWKAINKSKGKVLKVLVNRRAREWGIFQTPVPEEAIDALAVMEQVRQSLEAETEDFRRGSPIPDDNAQTEAPTPKMSRAEYAEA